MEWTKKENKGTCKRNKQEREEQRRTAEEKPKERCKSPTRYSKQGKWNQRKEKKTKDKAAILQKMLDKKEMERIKSARKITETKFLTEGETNSKYWFTLNWSKVPPYMPSKTKMGK